MKALIIFLFLIPCAAIGQDTRTVADTSARPKWNVQPVAVFLPRKVRPTSVNPTKPAVGLWKPAVGRVKLPTGE